MAIVIKVQGINDDSPVTIYDSDTDAGIVTGLNMSDENMKSACLAFDYRGDATLTEYGTLVAMWIDADCAFFGRVIQLDNAYGDGGERVRGVTCESAVGFLADSTVLKPPYVPMQVFIRQDYLVHCVNSHNAGFGYFKGNGNADREWTNARVCNGSVVPWEWIECDTPWYGGVDAGEDYDLGNDISLLDRMQQQINDFGAIVRVSFDADHASLTSQSNTNIRFLFTDSELISGKPIPVDAVARHGMNITDVSVKMGIDGVYTTVYATNKAGNEAYGENAALVAKYGKRQMRLTTDSEDQSSVASECAEYVSKLGLLENLECDISYIDLSLIDGGYVRPKVGQLWHIHSAPLGIHLKGWVKSCTWSADEPWSSHIVLHYCTEIEPE